MDIYQLITQDHRAVDGMFEAISEAVGDPSRARVLVDKLRDELLCHAGAEEVTFYKMIEDRSREADKRVDHAEHEHEEISKALFYLCTLESNDPQFPEALAELKKTVNHHVMEEEGKVFEAARKVVSSDEAGQLAREMADAKQTILRSLKNATAA